MLVIANGAYKSGSTWLFRIVHAMTGHALPPDAYARPNWGGTGVRPDMLAQFLDQIDYHDRGYVFKAHLYWSWPVVAGRRNVRVLNIVRDLRDVVVSAFYYERMKGNHHFDHFPDYYWSKGRHVAHFVTHYNGLWSRAPNAFIASYESLKSDFPAEVRRLAGFLEMDVDDDQIERVRTATTFERMRALYDQVSDDGAMHFYRKGDVGDWRSHFDEESLNDVRRIERRHASYPSGVDLLVHRIRGRFQRSKRE